MDWSRADGVGGGGGGRGEGEGVGGEAGVEVYSDFSSADIC